MKTFLKNTLSALFVLSILWLNIGAMEPEQKPAVHTIIDAQPKLVETHTLTNLPDELLIPILGNAILQDIRMANTIEEAAQKVRDRAAVNRQFERLMNDPVITRQVINALIVKFPKETQKNPVLTTIFLHTQKWLDTNMPDWREQLELIHAIKKAPLRAMILAIKYNRTDVIEVLLRNNFSINTRNYYGLTPLMWADRFSCEDSHKAVIEFLRKIGAKEYGEKDLIAALEIIIDQKYNSIKDIWILIHRRVSYSALYNCLDRAIQKDNFALIISILQNVSGIHCPCMEDRTFLMWATYRQQEEIVSLCLAKFGQVNITNKYGYTPLMIAISKGDAVIAQMLLAAQAKPDIQNCMGETALMVAVLCGHTNVVRLLLAHGAQTTIKDIRGKTAWDHANEHRNKAIMVLQNARIGIIWELFKAGGAPKWLYAATAAGAVGIGYAAYEWLFKKE